MPIRFRVDITRSAERDIEGIYNYIAADSPTRAIEFISKLERHISTLEQFPLRSPLIPENEILGTQYRNLIHGHYRTIFRISEKTIYVLRIIHGARLLDSSMFEI
jgi:plasmid stabilization system protein ParE